jgi:hypothetical protein
MGKRLIKLKQCLFMDKSNWIISFSTDKLRVENTGLHPAILIAFIKSQFAANAFICIEKIAAK